jgi:hypothetical protein
MPIFQGDWSPDHNDGTVSARRPTIGASILQSSSHLVSVGELANVSPVTPPVWRCVIQFDYLGVGPAAGPPIKVSETGFGLLAIRACGTAETFVVILGLHGRAVILHNIGAGILQPQGHFHGFPWLGVNLRIVDRL